MRKIIPFFVALTVLLFSCAASAGSPVHKESTSGLTLVSGKTLILPPFPGLVRVDGLYPEIDDYVISKKFQVHTAIFAPSEKIWVERHKIRLQGNEPERTIETFRVEAHNSRHTGDNVQKAIDIFSKVGKEDSMPCGGDDIPDSACWCYGVSNPATQGITLYAYTILDEQIIMFAFIVVQDFSKRTPAWIESQEQRILNWILRLREINHELVRR